MPRASGSIRFLRIASWSPSTSAPPWLAVALAANLADALRRNFSIDRLAAQDRESNARHLVGQRHSDELEGLLLDELLRPHPQRVRVGPTMKQHGMRPYDEQFAQLSIAHLRNAPEQRLAAGGVLLGGQSEKGGELARAGETRRILNARRHR